MLATVTVLGNTSLLSTYFFTLVAAASISPKVNVFVSFTVTLWDNFDDLYVEDPAYEETTE